ncbi:MAG: radical SAM protein [Oliverpabstia sp.]|nr:radical SAM protein [Lachnospiraceae bacterium]MDY5025262.1 radical SAM protein [Oliverpabstia sp.]
MKISVKENHSCTLCPRMCRVDRDSGQKGYCRMDSTVRGARAALHMWEEPCISGEKGSGAVFFSGCTLGCVFCQNRQIADGTCGKEISVERLSDIFLELQEKGAANINLVTASHFVLPVIPALEYAKSRGLKIPVVYNTGGYEKVETLRMLEGIVDVWLPDFKYMDSKLSEKYSRAKDYPEVAARALEEMVRQAGNCIFDEAGYIQKGVIVRHLILPGHTEDSKAVLQYLYETYKNKIYISVMNQYTPLPHTADMPPLNRKVTKREYDRVLDYALSLGIEQGYFQEGETAEESFIPLFDYEGLS